MVGIVGMVGMLQYGRYGNAVGMVQYMVHYTG